MPSFTTLVPKNDGSDSTLKPPLEDNFISLSVFGNGNGFLALPSGYTDESDPKTPDGLPFAMALIFRPNRIENTFKVAKLYEKQQIVVKLPRSVPLLGYKNSVPRESFFSYLKTFLCNLIF